MGLYAQTFTVSLSIKISSTSAETDVKIEETVFKERYSFISTSDFII